jgi:hypothetical protein
MAELSGLAGIFDRQTIILYGSPALMVISFAYPSSDQSFYIHSFAGELI